jgi:glyoxylase I family protein
MAAHDPPARSRADCSGRLSRRASPWHGARVSRPFAATEIDHVVLRCRDMDVMLSFYRDALGLDEERRVEAIGLVQLRAGRSLVDLVPDGDPAERRGANLDHFCLAVEAADADAIVAWAGARGIETLGEPATRYGARGYGPSVYLRDPEGNVVELKLEAADA